MKKVIVAAAVVASGFLAHSLVAQDPLEVGPDVYHKAFENEQVRVLEVAFAPGAKIGMHSHPDHFAYAMTDGRLVITRADGKEQELDAKKGQVFWIDAEAHSARNPGDTEMRLLVVELKEKR